MKLIIDIDERDYDLACKYPNALIATYAHYIKDGTPYEERPQGKWISVNERLPEEKFNPYTHDFQEVICATTFGDVRVYKYGTAIGDNKAHFYHGGWSVDNYILAWQPLPEPYKEAEKIEVEEPITLTDEQITEMWESGYIKEKTQDE